MKAAQVVLVALALHTGLLVLSTSWWLLALTATTGPCQLDNEGSWSIGIFKGPSPFEMQPLEAASPRQDTAVAWPVANPVLTCASVTDSHSNFVADPFLWHHDGKLYMFYESKSSRARRGEIGVAVSGDEGRSFRHLAIALQEPWHLSYPFVFAHEGAIYMLPETSKSGALYLYRAAEFPLRWERAASLINRPLVDASLVEWQGLWYMFASDHSRSFARPNGELEVFYAPHPLGPWKQHELNPVLLADVRGAARSAGRPFVHGGRLYRWGQDCGPTYGHALAALEVTKLSPTEFEQRRVAHNISGLPARPALKGAWNAARHHHADALRLPSGEWVAALDGDSVPSGPISSRVLRTLRLIVAPWLALAAAYAVGGVAVRHRGAARRWVMRVGAASSGLPLLGAALRPVVLLAQRSNRARRRKQHKVKNSMVFAPDWQLPTTRDMEGESPPSSGELEGESEASLQRSSPLGSVLSPRGSMLSPISVVATNGNGLLLPSSGSGSLQGGLALHSPLHSRSAARPHHPASQHRQRQQWTVLGLPLWAAVLGGLAVAALCTAAGMYAYAAPYLEPPPRATAVEGQASQFSLLVMTYESRMTTLRHFVRHYSRCSSVSEIVVVWNRGTPPVPERDFDSAVPVRVRVEAVNSLNNRFKQDPLIRNRAVLSLDDDIMMPCKDIERGFAAWRARPQKMVGFFPRLIEGEEGEGTPHLVFRGERYAVDRGGYNAVLTGAAFIDTWTAFPAYWADPVATSRAEVDRVFNGEDLLMNFALAEQLTRNASQEARARREELQAAFWGRPGARQAQTQAASSQQPGDQQEQGQWAAVEFIRPTRRLDISKLSGVGISHNWKGFKDTAQDYLAHFVADFGGTPLRTQKFDWSYSSPPFCAIQFLGCSYL
eukprot:scaffold2.g7508.t1